MVVLSPPSTLTFSERLKCLFSRCKCEPSSPKTAGTPSSSRNQIHPIQLPLKYHKGRSSTVRVGGTRVPFTPTQVKRFREQKRKCFKDIDAIEEWDRKCKHCQRKVSDEEVPIQPPKNLASVFRRSS
ncbi:hypothetical protein Ae201684P_022458 [Aphanomyces euteiches]|nr:hypothetical protein Ae201684P_022458 [Aphanomyces euteiches]KAH9133018.1 hypothetical protein AeRB84_020783 [Aphanomyces euteiches]